MSLEMAHKVILPPKKNYIPQFLKQRTLIVILSSKAPMAPKVKSVVEEREGKLQ
jgi:hypothetical protein